MNIPTRQEIKDILRETAQSEGYYGSAVDLVISLVSTGYYETIIKSLGILREGNAETAANINSLITLAVSRMYSVYRGTNPTLKIKGTTSKYQILRRGDKVYSSSDFNLYALTDTELKPNMTCTIPVIASLKFVKENKKHLSDRFFVEFLTEDIIEDVKLFIQTDQTQFMEGDVGDEAEVTKNFRKHSDDDTILDMTISGFGVRYYQKEKNDYNYTISTFKYLPDSDQIVEDFINSALAERKTNPTAKVNAKFDVKDFTVTNLTDFTAALPRESKEEIRINYNNQINSLYLIRSTSDLLDSFRAQFGYKLHQVNAKNYAVYEEDTLPTDFVANCVPTISNPGELELPFVAFFYVPKQSSNTITSAEMTFYRALVQYYYLFDHLYACPGMARNLAFRFKLKTNDSANAISRINSLIAEYNYKFNSQLFKSDILTQVMKLDEVLSLRDFMIYEEESIEFNLYGPITVGRSSTPPQTSNYRKTSRIHVNSGDKLIYKGSTVDPEQLITTVSIAGYDLSGDYIPDISELLGQGTYTSEQEIEIPSGIESIEACAYYPNVASSNQILYPYSLKVLRSLEEASCNQYEYFNINSIVETF